MFMSALEEFWASLAADDTCPRCGGELDTGWLVTRRLVREGDVKVWLVEAEG
jgi:hypothetical protein